MGRGSSTAESHLRQGRRRHSERRSRPPRRWTDEAIETELRRLVAENGGQIPTTARLASLGLSGLKQAMARKGVAYWAQRVGVPMAPKQDRLPYGIDDAQCDIAKVVAEMGYLPGSRLLRKLGYNRLSTFVMKEGGVQKLCTRHGIRLPSSPSPGRKS